jgi:CDP-diacylglycerol pyrophosphatase
MRHFRIWVAAALCLIPVTHADTRACLCDIAQPATLEVRECSLCREAEKQPSGIPYFFLKDASPNKPNRWLALPRFHGNNPQELQEMTPGQRAAYWKAAIDKAREVWGEDWGIALNSTDRRTQCHIHLHIGKLLPDSEDDRFVVADGPEGIPLPESGNGIWVHPVGGKYHAHVNVPAGELKLQK